MKLTIVLGNQLFPVSCFKEASHVFMAEDLGLCTHYKYHKHKIIFFLASMREFADELKKNDKKVTYYEFNPQAEFFDNLKETITKNKISEIELFEVEDKFFEQKIEKFSMENHLDLKIIKSPMFLVSRESFKKYNESTKKPFMKNFYEGLRKSTGILMNGGSPIGGKFSFDTENRKKIPKKFDVIENKIKLNTRQHTEDVKKIVRKHFSDHPGDCDNFWLYTTRKDALKVLDEFLNKKFDLFGPYEDAIDTRDPFLYHSILSPYMNIGFLPPEEIVKKTLKVDTDLNSKEGFIRQIIGWREFVRGIYREYSEEQENSNFFKHENKLNSKWYEASTGIIPLDDAIKKVDRYGYNHHIERLMIISNIMLLCEIEPNEVHRWFMEMYVDSSDWVMGPNVYGMAQFSDGGIFATKPYIASSNYILKMSHYKKDDWCDILDGLYWRFIDKNQDFFAKNYRMSMMVKMLAKLDEKRKNKIFNLAEEFIKSVTK